MFHEGTSSWAVLPLGRVLSVGELTRRKDHPPGSRHVGLPAHWPARVASTTNTSCIWCGQRTDGTDDGASFLFLAKQGAEFTRQPGSWVHPSPHAEGHQFFCHVACFRTSVPEDQEYLLELALDLP